MFALVSFYSGKYNICKVCQWLATGWWFPLVSSTNKTDCHDITEILLESDIKHHNPNPIISGNNCFTNSVSSVMSNNSKTTTKLSIKSRSIVVLIVFRCVLFYCYRFLTFALHESGTFVPEKLYLGQWLYINLSSQCNLTAQNRTSTG